MKMMLALALFLAPVGMSETFPQNVGFYSTRCRAHGTDTVPPSHIRVLMGHRVVRVPFKLYTARVVSSEWNTVPTQLRRAGAVAVKQYAWYKALRPRRSMYGCFDVHSTTQDQIYRVKTPPDYVWGAVTHTWSWRVLRGGKLIQTGYRTGGKHGCARDVDGYHLFARSAARCARLGWGARRILQVYYEGHVR